MSNVVRNGFSTLNRLLGKKNKNGSNGGLSKSSTNLNRSTTNLDATSQHNKITPLAASTNAPFEQTFRITICLPLDQLYVARVGAKTKLADVLGMVCTNKLLDPSKFEFRHPTDDTQVFELELTIGEVGLNEIRLAPKSCHAAAATEDIKFRTHSVVQPAHTQNDYRFSVINHNHHQRPHTISASPYSSTNSLNSTDSSGPNSSFRSNAMPSAPCRKKRVAPRPPSQNSIPEDKEQIVERKNGDVADDGVFKRPQLIRQNFHVSSPNLMQTNLSRCTKNESNADMSLPSSDQATTPDDHSLGRPLSMQLHEDEMSNGNAYGSRTHSRTSSDTSDNIIRDGNWPEPAPRKRIFIGRKKAAPSPPPRISSVNHVPVATPRNILQKLTEEQSKEIEEVVELKCEEIAPQTPTSVATTELTATDREISQPQEPTAAKEQDTLPKLNVSKVMLNVDDASAASPEATANESIEHIFSHKIIQTSNSSPTNSGRNVSRTQINGTMNEPIASTPKKKSISVVDLNVDHSDAAEIEKRLSELEHAELSKEVNEIIHKAIEINEARLTSVINGDGDDWLPGKVDEVNNNNSAFNAKSESPLWIYTLPAPPTFADGKAAAAMKLEEKCTENDSGVCAASPKGSLSSDDEVKSIATTAERPIEPIISEKSPIDFHHDTSDNSLPTSSTYGTMSTEPESLRTSDIEDGYKGNSASHAVHVNGEQFVENEFEFLANERYDGESSASPSPIKEEPPKITNGSKANVIEELTTIISANRLDTVIKPNDETDAIETTVPAKRSTLSNFQIGAYNGNGNHENACPKPVAPSVAERSPAGPRYKRHSLVENAFEENENGVRRSSTPKRVSLTNGLGLGVDTRVNEDTHSNAMKAPKYVSRSKSFHSTLSWSAVRNANAENRFESLAQTPPRSTSFVSLNGSQRGLNDATRQRSSSELSIADSPSLQSVEVLKSIMNSSRKNSVSEQPATIKLNVTEKTIEINAKPDIIETVPLHANVNGNGKPKIEPKTWKYEGPPSINLSTWGERPKSQVFIKSDTDYKFGGMSKMAALQKRFSASIADTENTKRNSVGESDACKLPIVRGVEYKRNVSTDQNGNNGDIPSSVDTIDSEAELRPARRPSYEISRIVTDKPSNYTTMTLGRVPAATKNVDSPAKKQFGQNRNSIANTNGNAYVQRGVSFNGNVMHAPVVKGFKAVDIIGSNNAQQHESRQQQPQQPLVKLSTYEAAPPFSQFTLRKTGLKEKILDESNNNNNNINHNTVNGGQLKSNYAVQRSADELKNKRNTIPTAPKPPPPPISQKPIGVGGRSNGNGFANSMHRSQSMPVDTRNQLLDSIRNFNRTALKKS